MAHLTIKERAQRLLAKVRAAAQNRNLGSRGVFYETDRGMYRVRDPLKQGRWLGRFYTAEEAARAFEAAKANALPAPSPVLLLPPPELPQAKEPVEPPRPSLAVPEDSRPWFERYAETRRRLFAKYSWMVGEQVFVDDFPSWKPGSGLWFPRWSGIGVIERIDYGDMLTVIGEGHQATISPENYHCVRRVSGTTETQNNEK